MFKTNSEHTYFVSDTVSDHSSVQYSDENYQDKNFDLALKYIKRNKGLGYIFQNQDQESTQKIVSAKLSNGMTLLHCSVSINAQQAVQDLLLHGADVNAKDQSGNIPIHYANSTSIAALLIDNNSDVNTLNSSGYSLLTKAFICDNLNLVQFLFQKQVDVENFKEYCGIEENYGHDKLLNIALSGIEGYHLDEY